MDATWFKSLQKRAGITSFDLGAAIGRDRTVISRIINGGQKMTLEQAQILAQALGVTLDEMIEKGGLAGPATAQQFAPGFYESDAAPYVAADSADRSVRTVAEVMGARAGVDVWQVRGSTLQSIGYLPGDFVLVDTHIADRARPGDVVIAQVYDRQRATTVMRRWQPPVLVNPQDQSVLVVDHNNVVVRGVVTASWRARH